MMETKQIIHSLRDKADRAADLSWARIMHTAADRLWVLEHRLNDPDKTVGKWVPVTERLPERNDDGTVNAVLVTNGSVQHIAYLAKDIFHFTENGEMKEPMFYEVTHWMPLPEPPKEV